MSHKDACEVLYDELQGSGADMAEVAYALGGHELEDALWDALYQRICDDPWGAAQKVKALLRRPVTLPGERAITEVNRAL